MISKKINMKKYLLLLIATVAISCEEKSIQPTHDVEEAYNKWKSLGINSYSIIQTKQCFCIDAGIKAIIIVDNNKIISVEDSSRVIKIPKERWDNFKTINQLFETAIDAKKNKPADFIIEYDENYKFPTYLYVNPSSSLVDEEYGYVTTNFQPLK